MGSFIAIVCDANMNLGVLQCKNCWKWGQIADVCHIQEAKCVKYNEPHQTVHHQHYAWCCKANKKTNSSRLETKKGNLCPHMFKCLNYKGDYQADSNECPFWKHRFNKEWHSKEYAKIWDNQKNLACSAVNGNTIWLWRTWRSSLKMFKRTTSLSTLYSKSITISMLSSSKNCLEQLLGLFPALRTVKAFLW